ncbi:MAG TPA: hypothetical protein VGE98_05420, partial [Thermoanaerobaculia bacterium]
VPALPVRAQTTSPPAEAPADPARLEKELAELRAEIAEMKKKQAAELAKPGAPAVAPPDGRVAELERKVDVLAQEIERLKIGEAAASADKSTYHFGPAASKVYRTEHGLSIGGYGELLYQHARDEQARIDSPDDEVKEVSGSRADLQRAVVYVGYKWDDHWVFNSELEWEHTGGEVDVEFAYLDYLWRREMNVRAGLLLLPMGFVNELHEPSVLLTALRPEVERYVLPTTWEENGLGVFGDVGPFTYRTYLLAGLNAEGFDAQSGLRGGRQQGEQSKVDDLAWVGRLDYTGVPGLTLGASGYFGNSGQGKKDLNDRPLDVPVRIFEAHAEWRYQGLELRGLFARTTLGDVARLNDVLGKTGTDSIGERMQGYYLQAGYDLLAGRGKSSLTPYVRFEKYNTQDRVPTGFAADPLNDIRSWTVGLSWKPIDQVAIKGDYAGYRDGTGHRYSETHVLLGYIF